MFSVAQLQFKLCFELAATQSPRMRWQASHAWRLRGFVVLSPLAASAVFERVFFGVGAVCAGRAQAHRLGGLSCHGRHRPAARAGERLVKVGFLSKAINGSVQHNAAHG
jgi:hypothetical protein